MSTFIELIKTGKTKGAYLKKQSLLGSVKTELIKIGSLDVDNPSLRIFEKTQEGANAILKDFATASRELNFFLFEQNPEIYDDKEYQRDTNSDVTLTLEVQNELEKYIAIMNDKNIKYPPDEVPAQ